MTTSGRKSLTVNGFLETSSHLLPPPEIRNMSIADLKHQELPLARIKKIMKLDEDVKVSDFLKLTWC